MIYVKIYKNKGVVSAKPHDDVNNLDFEQTRSNLASSKM